MASANFCLTSHDRPPEERMIQEMESGFKILRDGPLSSEEMERVRGIGKYVYGK